MTIARREIVPDHESGVYHCISRCVRRAFLCGFDRFSGKDFSHRRDWIKNRLQELAQAFGVQVFGYAVMSNHLHIVLRMEVEESQAWSAEEIAKRWLKIFPRRRDRQGAPCEPTASEIKQLVADKPRVRELRARLCSVSWFMRCLNEHVARMANREDNCKGRFWEGRFKCQRLLDQGAVLACMAYVDLNPIRARAAVTLQDSTHTSVHDRLISRKAKTAVKHLREQQKSSPLSHRQEQELQRKQEQAGFADWLADLRGPTVEITLEEYLCLLDWTGRQLRAGKRGRLAPGLEPILARMQIDHENWLETVQSYGSLFWRVAGTAGAIARAASQAGRKWLKGLCGSRTVFLAPKASAG